MGNTRQRWEKFQKSFTINRDEVDFRLPIGAARNISELCKSLICRHSLKNAGEVVLAVFFIGEGDFDSMGVDLSGRNFAKTIVKDSGVPVNPAIGLARNSQWEFADCLRLKVAAKVQRTSYD